MHGKGSGHQGSLGERETEKRCSKSEGDENRKEQNGNSARYYGGGVGVELAEG